MPRDARRDLFADAKVILRCRAVILYSPLHSRSEYHPATPDITAEGNITRRKANITEKRTYESKCVFLARLAGLEPTALRIGI